MAHPDFLPPKDDPFECLLHLIEECAEVSKCGTKMLRFGPDNYNPFVPEDERETNFQAVERELADLEKAIARYREACRIAQLTEEHTKQVQADEDQHDNA